MKPLRLLSLLLLVYLFGCGEEKDPAKEKTVVAQDPEEVNKLVTDFIEDHLAKVDTSHAMRIDGDTMIAIPLVKKVYAARGYQSIWSDKGKLNAAGDSLYSILKNAEYYGLIPGDYHIVSIDSMMSSWYNKKDENYNVNEISCTDMLLTNAFFTFSVHVSAGRIDNDSSTARVWKLNKVDTDLVALLDNALKSNNFRKTFDGIEPQCNEYRSVKKYLHDYRVKYDDVKWDVLPDRKTDSAGFFAGVKKRLIITGDYDSTSIESDSVKLADALKKFQKRYFLEPDGKIGRNTILTLAMTPEDWQRQLAMNMERWRWEPKKFEKRHMIVNLPAFKMTVWEADTIVMESRIVCGQVDKQTPELDSKMYQIVLYPYWNVPYSIAWKELLPHIKRDTGYIRKEHYEVLNSKNEVVDYTTIKWSRYGKGNLPYKFRQMTGDENALGIMKFEFQNKYSVYMHDTNAKKYFKFETRAFSHGCMRLEKYMELAHFLIRDDSVKLPKDTFDYYTTLDSNMKINLRKPLPIHVRYNTCDVDTDGNVFVHSDIYLRDQRMMKVLYKTGNWKNMKGGPETTPVPAAPASTDPKKKTVMWRRKQDDDLLMC
ncbi:MAG TPA: L,D-transpeptidase family protein [Bacteroidia bacterium]|jgi:murein L,D-transpeptidase YcbB/YkuD|nr:L,D-transpeptidase family protein [Bacteroidia bacterium]